MNGNMLRTRSFFWNEGNHKPKFEGKTYKYHSAYYLKTEADEMAEDLRKVAISARVSKKKDAVGHVCYVVFWRR